MPYNSDGTDKNGRIGPGDVPRVTRDEALELMVHHLQMAEVYYQATPEDEEAVAREMERIMSQGALGNKEPALVAARPWLSALNLEYAIMKKELG